MSNALNIIDNGFDCPRTCPRFERVDLCRFNPLLRLLGNRFKINSESVAVDVKFNSADALTYAIEQQNGQPLGFGSFELYQRNADGKRQSFDGFGFQLPEWQFPLIAGFDGKLHFDDYNGHWGNPADVERLRNDYAIAAGRNAADSLGWLHETTADGLRVFHPTGGELLINGAGVDALGFVGTGCHTAAQEITQVLGNAMETITKPEFFDVEQSNAIRNE